MVQECNPLRKLASRNEETRAYAQRLEWNMKKPIGAYIGMFFYEFECKIFGLRRLPIEFLQLLVQPSSLYDF